MARRNWRFLLAPVVALGLVAALPQAYGAFSATTTGSGTFGSAAAFPTYTSNVTTVDGSAIYHRMDAATAYGASSTAADSSGNNRAGTLTGPSDGPSTWYKFDDGSGSAAADASGAANQGTLVNSPTWGAGVVGGALTLDGSSRYVTAPRSGVDTSASFSVSAWAYVSDRSANRVVVSQDGTNVSAFMMRYEAARDRWMVDVRTADSTGGGTAEVLGGYAPALNRWTHLALVYDDTNDLLRFFIDGVLVTTAAKTTDWSATGPLIVGAGLWNAARASYFNGGIDDVRVFRRALNDAEIAKLYGPQTHWDMDAVSSTQVDQSGNLNTGTALGGVSFSSNGINLDGTTDRVVGVTSGVHTNRSFAVAALISQSSVAGTRTIVSQPGTNASAFTLSTVGTAYQFSMTSADTAAPTTSTATATTVAAINDVVHVVGVYSSPTQQLRIYINGVLEASAPMGTPWDATGPLTVGQYRSAGTDTGFYQGNVRDVRVFNHTLTNDDVYNLYAAPQARYDMEEKTGTTLTDGSGNGNTATRTGTGTTWQQSSHRGASMALSSSSYFATATNVLDTSTSYSVSAWVWLPSANTGSGGNRTIIAQDGANVSPFLLQHTNADGTNQWEFQVMGADSATTPSAQIVLSAATAVGNRWTHLAATYDDPNNTVKIYVNGVLSGTSTSASTDFASSGALTVGAGKYAGARVDYWPGYLDDVAAYQRVLSAADVTALFGQTPQVQWDVNEGAGTTVGDRSGAGNSGTASNTTWNATGVNGSNSLTFDGTSSQVVTSGAPVTTDTSFSVSLWVYLTDATATRVAVSQNGTNIYGYALGYDNALNKWFFRMKTADATGSGTMISAESTSTPATGTWTHLTGIYHDESDQIRLFVNGEWEDTTTHTTDWNATGVMALGYGRWTGAAAYRWIGRLDDVTVHQKPLINEEITALYTNTTPTPTPNAAHNPMMTAGLTGALQGAQQGLSASTAIAFNGQAHLYNAFSYVSPSTFTLEGWLRVTGSQGGTVAGFTTSTTGTTAMTTIADRVVYVDSGGRLSFGVSPGGVKTVVRSTTAVNDGVWHHWAASLGGSGMKIYVDGVLQDSNAGVTTALTATGYWRWGAINLSSWANAPTSHYLTGTLDEVSTYTTQLDDTKLPRHYASNH
jgi:hypothetical protein